MSKRALSYYGVACVAVIVMLATGGVVVANVVNTSVGLRASADSPVAAPKPMSDILPKVAKGRMAVTSVDSASGRATSVLSFDDGSCEAGLGAGVAVTALVDFDVPTQCSQAGLDIVGVSARMNTGSAMAFAFGQGGATPPVPTSISTVPLTSNILPTGACPTSPGALVMRSLGPSAAVITGTSNFFAGVQNTGFLGRDTNSAPAGRLWLNCVTCGVTQYSPTTLTGLGLGGNWMIRVTVEDANCTPVELMSFSSDE